MKTKNYLKHISVILSISILFQSCYSYKTIEGDEIKLSKKYKIELKNSEKLKGKIINISNDSLQLIKNGKTINIFKENILEIKKRKFSYLKTGLTTLTVAAISLLAIFRISINIFKKGFNPLKDII